MYRGVLIVLSTGQVVGLVLRGIFMIRKHEINWFYQRGADHIFPDGKQTVLSATATHGLQAADLLLPRIMLSSYCVLLVSAHFAFFFDELRFAGKAPPNERDALSRLS